MGLVYLEVILKRHFLVVEHAEMLVGFLAGLLTKLSLSALYIHLVPVVIQFYSVLFHLSYS